LGLGVFELILPGLRQVSVKFPNIALASNAALASNVALASSPGPGNGHRFARPLANKKNFSFFLVRRRLLISNHPASQP
jgi:hypothetical protein